MMQRLSSLLLLLCALVALVSANSAPSFCKCTCFKNSTIVALDDAATGTRDEHTSLRRSTDSSLFAALDAVPILGLTREKRSTSPPTKRAASAACSQCTKAFCLSKGLDICKDATEDDVVTTCFQRDSNKDKIIVWGFILGTSGLLGWAAFKKVLEHRQSGAGYSFLGRGRN
ncbi:hypothetical protein F5X68DRAFT_200609 [Plectosphaerella plurivora]|uniref:MFS transporter n=1 Tax=Plectosphaerella plurivora TaxID=936078 RepID=A0A9P8VIQ7_9PEZI|nr:hypothetical protein F5X68DRAFT_200609 [Plectosphaerella plurivora]